MWKGSSAPDFCLVALTLVVVVGAAWLRAVRWALMQSQLPCRRWKTWVKTPFSSMTLPET
jgi:hypothetical protein